MAIPALISALALVPLAGCSDSSESSSDSTVAQSSSAASDVPLAEDGGEFADLKEVSRIVPRVVLSSDEGITTVDAVSGEVIAKSEHEGFLRLNGSSDGRTVFVTDSDKILDYDAAVHVMPHGDHNHYYSGDPSITRYSFGVPHAGHVVNHDGLTALFSDGDGKALVVNSDQADEDNTGEVVATFTADAPHHGVAVPLADGSVVMTNGTEDYRDTVRHVAADGSILAETNECPGVHGEATAADGRLFFGCEDGPVIFDGSDFHKVKVEDSYARSGNSAGFEDSPIVLSDYKVDKDAEQERPTRIALTDTRTYSLKTVELGSSYWFRSLGRGPEGEALVLTYDGHLKVIDPESGEITNDIEAIAPWEEKEEWQEPGPILKVAGDVAYITDAENQELVLVDLTTGEVTQRHELGFSPTEMAIADGRSSTPTGEDEEHEAEHADEHESESASE